MNQLSVGMSKPEMLAVMGPAVSTSARRGVECSEYMLLAHSENFVHNGPTRYYVTLTGNKVVEYGEGSCNPSYMEKAAQRETIDAFSAISVGMGKPEFLKVMLEKPSRMRVEAKYGLECLDYDYSSSNGHSEVRFVAFKNGILIAFGNSTCDQEATSQNFTPGGKYYYLIEK